MAVADARRYAAVLRALLGICGVAIVALHPAAHPRPWAALTGCVVIALTGLAGRTLRGERWLRIEEPLSCVAAFAIVGLGEGRVTVLTLLWLVSAAVGVLARGGRVGQLARILVVAALAAPAVEQGTLTATVLGQAVAAIALLQACGRISRQTSALLRDPLTGTLARAAFVDHVNRTLASLDPRRPAGLIMFDLDDFGIVNKTHGYAAGDALLVAAATAIGSALRPGDILGRIGGDEFAALVFAADPLAAADAVLAAVAPTSVRLCAGVARAPRDGRTTHDLIASADIALRVAKRDGKDRAALYTGASLSDPGPDGAHAIMDRLCAGDGVAVLVQPIVDVEGGVVHAYEALARFRTDGAEGPQHWLALADTLGRRRDLELACLRAALALLGELPGPASLTVNLSGGMLADERAQAMLCRTPRVDRLVLEITEEKLVSSHASVERAIALLRGRGARFAVDDVGVGYAGLGQIAVLRPDYLKLDRSLVQGVERDPDRARFLRAVANYARDTGCALIAEGIETEAQLAELRRAGIALVQGFLVGRPAEPWPVQEQQALAA